MNLTLKRNKKITTEEIKNNIDKNGNVIISVEEPEEINFISASYRRKTLPGKYVTVEMLQEANYVTEERLQQILQEANYVTEERLQKGLDETKKHFEKTLKEANYVTEEGLQEALDKSLKEAVTDVKVSVVNELKSFIRTKLKSLKQ